MKKSRLKFQKKKYRKHFYSWFPLKIPVIIIYNWRGRILLFFFWLGVLRIGGRKRRFKVVGAVEQVDVSECILYVVQIGSMGSTGARPRTICASVLYTILLCLSTLALCVPWKPSTRRLTSDTWNHKKKRMKM